ncbi:hypothetical protein ACSAGD_13530 [Paramicrobacterium sp. CJ85]|uniref:hypothetical protein n=1 Tax=Paramicrobacterium sp. CJ85 TaxID=3445355 RepID=UPI003F5F04E0
MASGVPAYAATPDPDLHYAMDELTGTTVADSSGNGWDGETNGKVELVASDEGSALDLQGGHVIVPREVLDGAQDLTVATRVRWDGDGGA